LAVRSAAWTVFARSNTGIVGSNLIWLMDVCVRLLCLCCPMSKESYGCVKIRKLKKRPRFNKGNAQPEINSIDVDIFFPNHKNCESYSCRSVARWHVFFCLRLSETLKQNVSQIVKEPVQPYELNNSFMMKLDCHLSVSLPCEMYNATRIVCTKERKNKVINEHKVRV
jgi:hypothetical protein